MTKKQPNDMVYRPSEKLRGLSDPSVAKSVKAMDTKVEDGRKLTNFRIDPDLHSWLRHWALDHGESMTEVIVRLIEEFRTREQRKEERQRQSVNLKG